MDEEQLNPTQLQLLPQPSQCLAQHVQAAWERTQERPGTPRPAHGSCPSSCHQHPAPGKKALKDKAASGGDLSPAPLCPTDLRGTAPAKREQSLAWGLLLTAFVCPDVQLLRQLGDHQEGPPALALLGFEDVSKDMVSDVQDILPFGPQQVTDCVR